MAKRNVISFCLCFLLVLGLSWSCRKNYKAPSAPAQYSTEGNPTDPSDNAALHEGVKSCNGCHIEKRPIAPHDQQSDCISCHTYPEWKSSITSLHNPKPDSCNSCHEKDRPTLPHVAEQDCVGCHSPSTFIQSVSAFNHEPKPQNCVSCHEKNRPAAPHVAGKDCVGCHSFPTFTSVSFSHTPKPAMCEECHVRPATTGIRAYPNQGPPVGFVADDPAALGSRHYLGKDCSSCHKTPDEGAAVFTFTHSTPKAEFCLPCHFNEGREGHNSPNRGTFTEFGDCFTCHKNFDKDVLRNWNRGG